jgi:ATP-binding cassette subfamily B protein
MQPGARIGSQRSGELEVKPRTSDWAILRRIASYARPYWLHGVVILLLSLLAAPIALLTPLPVKIVVDHVLGSQPLPRFLAALIPGSKHQSGPFLLALAAGLILAVALLNQIQGLTLWMMETYAGEGMVLAFRSRLFGHVQRLSLTYHDAQGTADSSFRIQYDAPALQNITISGVIPLVSALMTLAGMIYVTARIDPQLAVVAVAISPVLYLLTRAFSSRLRDRWENVKTMESSANSVVQEALSSVRVVKAFGREDHEQQRFLHRSAGRLHEAIRLAFLQSGFDLLIGMTLAAGTAITLYIGVMHVRSGALSLGELVLVLAYVAQLYQPLQAVSKKLADIQGSLASAERAFALLDELPEVIERPHARPLTRARGDIKFENVSFAYDGQNSVLSGVTFTAPAGARVGIQGQTGAGKSTLMSLLTRFYDVSGGRILVDGVDASNYKLADFRRQFGIVLQDAVLFSASITENIAYGRPEASDEQIVEAAKLANAHDFINALPDGYDTQVGERGMRLSGGERQRISLTRAFLRDAPILILDEPTSSLDMKTEAAILEALERLMRGRTTFMIAHRIGTLDNCDLRLVLDAGTVRILAPISAARGGA